MTFEREKFSEAEYFNAYKPIRNKLRRYDPFSIFASCIKYLYQPTRDEIEQLKKKPWLALLLIKWTFLDDQFAQPGRQSIEPSQLHDLLQLMSDLQRKARMPNQYDHHTLFLRNSSYQQFVYQYACSLNSIARQQIIFGEVVTHHLFRAKFREVTGQEVDTFTSLSLALLSRFPDRKNFILYRRWFDPLIGRYSSKDVDSFLENIAVPVSLIRERLAALDRGNRKSYEYYEQTPFLKFPLIDASTSYWCVYPNLLYRTLEHFIYDTLRDWDAGRFMDKFGEAFERYVERAISYAGLRYYPEATLEEELEGEGKLVDFLIIDAGANVLVDAKAVEMAYQGKVAVTAEILKDRTKNSILKAVEQAYEVASRLDSLENHADLGSRDRTFLLVVTYKELFLGSGLTFYEVIAKEKIDEIMRKYGGELIPPENMYFVTIDELELLMEGIKVRKIEFVDALEKAKAADSNPKTRKFDFRLHLIDWGLTNSPAYLRQVCNDKTEELDQILKAKQDC